MTAFNHGNEAEKRAYIDSILIPCAAWVNTNAKEKVPLRVSMEVQFYPGDVNTSARANYVVSKGPRKMIVVEAKNTNVPKGTFQTKATMEAARIVNKEISEDWSCIKGICTDMQNWTFLERDSGVIREEECLNGMQPEFPEQLWRMVRKLYAMLLDL
ncbi:hypothetical protein BBJ28_00026836 [Nothophytophthora sp. Chile5]|nr:hypothetical protein BBJ28_00026836 [Nothophytophthora sp. Chile5]